MVGGALCQVNVEVLIIPLDFLGLLRLSEHEAGQH